MKKKVGYYYKKDEKLGIREYVKTGIDILVIETRNPVFTRKLKKDYTGKAYKLYKRGYKILSYVLFLIALKKIGNQIKVNAHKQIMNDAFKSLLLPSKAALDYFYRKCIYIYN